MKPKKRKFCVWVMIDGGFWKTDCHARWAYEISSGAVVAFFKYCPLCGKEIKVKEANHE